MIDGVKCLSVSTFSENIRNNPLLKSVEKAITENNETVYIYPYCGLTFKVRNNSVSLNGSLHKYFNAGQNNNDFTRTQLIEVLNDLWDRFEINPHCTTLNTLEIGVNLNYQPQKFIYSIIDYKGESIAITNKDFLCSKCELSRYTMKAYNKDGLLRVEVHFSRMQDLKKVGIKYLSDLITPENFKIMGKMLLDYFDNYLTFDNTLNMDSLPPREREIILNGQNPRFWRQLHETSPENYKKQRARFKELIQVNQQNTIQKDVRNLIEEKLFFLCELERTFPELTESNKPHLDKRTFPELTESNKSKRPEFDTSKNVDFPRINHLDEVDKRGKYTHEIKHNFCDENKLKPEKKKPVKFRPVKITRKKPTNNNLDICEGDNLKYNSGVKICPVTKLNLFMQDSKTKYLTTEGVKWYYENDPETWDKLKKRIARSKYKTETLEVQFREIAHNIRNKDRDKHNNPRNNTKLAIKKVLRYPALFNNIELIRPEKRMIAGI